MYGVRVAFAARPPKLGGDVALRATCAGTASAEKWPGPQGDGAGPGLVGPQQREAGGSEHQE